MHCAVGWRWCRTFEGTGTLSYTQAVMTWCRQIEKVENLSFLLFFTTLFSGVDILAKIPYFFLDLLLISFVYRCTRKRLLLPRFPNICLFHPIPRGGGGTDCQNIYSWLFYSSDSESLIGLLDADIFLCSFHTTSRSFFVNFHLQAWRISMRPLLSAGMWCYWLFLSF